MRASFLFALVALCGLAACESSPDAPALTEAPAEADSAASALANPEYAVATLLALGESGVSGAVEFRRLGEATEVRYTVDGLVPGDHGFHLHRAPDCGADSTGEPGSAAGPHFNPLTSLHGAPSSALMARHAGDLGNLTADGAGHAEGIVIDSVLAFEGPTALVGRSVIVHAGRDDLETQPGGDAGARIACGVAEARVASTLEPRPAAPPESARP